MEPINQDIKPKNRNRGNRKSPGAAICSALGSFLLIALIALCLPLTAPKAFGYHIYTVISGSMEPAVPGGSLVYIESVEPEDVAEGDVIAFYSAEDQASIITHRVVENRVLMGEFITKGDANRTQDMNPAPYANFIGIVRLTAPHVGRIAQVLTSTAGKIAAACAVAAAVLFHIAAAVLDRR